MIFRKHPFPLHTETDEEQDGIHNEFNDCFKKGVLSAVNAKQQGAHTHNGCGQNKDPRSQYVIPKQRATDSAFVAKHGFFVDRVVQKGRANACEQCIDHAADGRSEKER